MKQHTWIISSLTLYGGLLLQGCSDQCYPTELQFAAELEKKGCQDLGWAYWGKEKKNLRAIACTTSGGDTYYQFEVTQKGLCELAYLRESGS